MIEEFLTPNSIEQALKLKKEYKNAQFIAGGTWINNFDNKHKPHTVISLDKLGLTKITDKKEGCLAIEACATIQEIVDNEKFPCILKEACLNVASRNIRNIATIGGEIGLKSTFSDIIPSLVALDASVWVQTDEGQKQVSVFDYVSKKKDDLIVCVCVPNNKDRVSCCKKFSRTKNGTPLLQVAVSGKIENNKILEPVIALGCIEDTIIRLNDIESLIDGKVFSKDENLEKAIKASVKAKDDWRASAVFRKHLSAVIVADCLEKICEEAK